MELKREANLWLLLGVKLNFSLGKDIEQLCKLILFRIKSFRSWKEGSIY